MAKMITMPDQDIYYQYANGRDLLSATLIERRQLLWELETLAKAPEETRRDGAIVRFGRTRAQTLLCELSLVTERIDSLVVLINGYAEQCGKPHVEITETKAT
jgi:hypothetical protein